MTEDNTTDPAGIVAEIKAARAAFEQAHEECRPTDAALAQARAALTRACDALVHACDMYGLPHYECKSSHDAYQQAHDAYTQAEYECFQAEDGCWRAHQAWAEAHNAMYLPLIADTYVGYGLEMEALVNAAAGYPSFDEGKARIWLDRFKESRRATRQLMESSKMRDAVGMQIHHLPIDEALVIYVFDPALSEIHDDIDAEQLEDIFDVRLAYFYKHHTTVRYDFDQLSVDDQAFLHRNYGLKPSMGLNLRRPGGDSTSLPNAESTEPVSAGPDPEFVGSVPSDHSEYVAWRAGLDLPGAITLT